MSTPAKTGVMTATIGNEGRSGSGGASGIARRVCLGGSASRGDLL